MPLLNVLTQNLSSELWITFSSVNQSLNFHLSHQLKISQTDLQNISRIKLLTSVQWYMRNKNKMIMIMNHLVWIHQTWSALILSVTVEEICKTIMCARPTSNAIVKNNCWYCITCYHTNSQFISNHWKISFFTKISNNNSIAKEGLTRSGIIEKLSSCV